MLVKEEKPQIQNNSGSTKGLNNKRFRERKTPCVFDMFQYLQSNDAAIQYLKSKDVLTSRVNDNCEELIARSSGSAGYKPAPRRCKGTLVERKFHNKDGQGDPVYSRYYRCTACNT